MVAFLLFLFLILNIYYYSNFPKHRLSRPLGFTRHENLIWFLCLILDISLALALAVYIHLVLFLAPFAINHFVARHFLMLEVKDLMEKHPQIKEPEAIAIIQRQIRDR